MSVIRVSGAVVVLLLMGFFSFQADVSANISRTLEDDARNKFIKGFSDRNKAGFSRLQSLADVEIVVEAGELSEVTEKLDETTSFSAFSSDGSYRVTHFTNFFRDKESEKSEEVSQYFYNLSHTYASDHLTIDSSFETLYSQFSHYNKNDAFQTVWNQAATWRNRKSFLTVQNRFQIGSLRANSADLKPTSFENNDFNILWSHDLTPKTTYKFEYLFSNRWIKNDSNKDASKLSHDFRTGFNYKFKPNIDTKFYYTHNRYRIPKLGTNRSVDSNALTVGSAFLISPRTILDTSVDMSFSEFKNEDIHTVGTKFRTSVRGTLAYSYSPKTTLALAIGNGTLSKGLVTADDQSVITGVFSVAHQISPKIKFLGSLSGLRAKERRLVQQPLSPTLFFRPESFTLISNTSLFWDLAKYGDLELRYRYEKIFADLEGSERVSQVFLANYARSF